MKRSLNHIDSDYHDVDGALAAFIAAELSRQSASGTQNNELENAGNTLANLPRAATQIPPRLPFYPSLFNGHIRGSNHYEAKLPHDTMSKFIDMMNYYHGRAATVKSAKFTEADTFRNSGLVDLFNYFLIPYRLYFFQDTKNFLPLTAAALRLRDYQANMAAHAPQMGLIAPNGEALNFLQIDFIERAPLAIFLELYLDLFVRLCPNLQLIEIPQSWQGHLVIAPIVLKMWREECDFDLEVKEDLPGQCLRLGRKGGWNQRHSNYWFNLVAADIAKHG
ncbi:hypothetical protein BU23DRAFT_567793 [Bimuria novae-zelandiae CBS 107.79]|uniref:Uncharacterized protein n=1 Tax=Bimuria novae-zelandiae CBS 107.79 TaxID=1447943 RepID=A0A6A5VCC2_9PLEO|nr:hypothetical protein BU23DRAFT_567793 [Bimuria novae-zelandiae CBS 107.79]